MDQSLDAIVGPFPTEEAFLIALKLLEGPPTPMTEGLGNWKWMYQLASESGDFRGATFALQNIYSALNSSGRTGESLLCARRFFAIAASAGDPLLLGHALNNIAWAFWVMGNQVAAFDVAQKAVRHAAVLEAEGSVHPRSAFTGPQAVRSMAADLLRTIRTSRKYLRRAVADHEAILAIWRERGDSVQVTSALESLGLVHNNLGDYAAALNCFEEALRETDTAAFSDARARLLARAGLLGNLAVAHTHQGDSHRALTLIEEEMRIYDDLSDDFGQIGALGQRGRAELRAGRVSEAILSLQRMLEIALRFGAEAWQGAAHFNLARAHIAAGDLSKAAFHAEEAAAIARYREGRVSVELTWLRAIIFAPITTNWQQSDVGRFIALAYWALGALREEIRSSLPPVVIGQWIDEFEILIDTILRLPSSMPLQLGARVYGKSPTEQAIEELVVKSPFAGWLHADIGLFCVESMRAQGFQERLLLDSAELQEGLDQGLVAKLARIDKEIELLDRSQPIVVTGTALFGDGGELTIGERESDESVAKQERAYEKHYQRRAELAIARDALVRRTLETPESKAAPLPEPARLVDLQEALHEDELFLEFVLLGQPEAVSRRASNIVERPASSRQNAAYVIAIRRSWIDVIPLGPTEEIEAHCTKLLAMLDRFGESLSLALFESEAGAIYDLLLRPVWTHAGAALDGVRHLIVAPDGALHRLPIDLSIVECRDARSWGEIDFLARHFSTEYAPSATVFIDARLGRYRRGKPGSVFVGFGDPAYSPSWQPQPLEGLPGTRRELEAISALVRDASPHNIIDPVRLFLGSAARKASLADQRLLAEAGYIHLACHGSAGRLPYSEGALYLAQVEGETPMGSVLTSREVMDLRTNARLVVLSACESGLGDFSRGEGIQGLTRAWLFAGAEAVVATQWPIDDEATAELMTTMYGSLLTDPGSAAEALVGAKQAAIASDRFACPVFWAGFVLTGGRAEGVLKPRETVQLQPDGVKLSEGTPKSVEPSKASHALLAECARAWEATWKTKNPTEAQTFCAVAAELGHSLEAKYGAIDFTTHTILRIVQQNCRLAWQHWSKQHQPALAVEAYRAYVNWLPSERTVEWDALASAYRRENRDRVRRLARDGELTRRFELRVEAELDSTLRTAVSWTAPDREGDLAASAIEIALPAEPGATCSADMMSYCRQIEWATFRVARGETVFLTEQLHGIVHTIEEDVIVIGGTWGSTRIPQELAICFHPDFVPLRLQRERLGGKPSEAAVRFGPEGAVVTIRPNNGPWLERIAILFRRARGALELFAAPNSPFLAETEFGEFERLCEQARLLAG